MELILDTTGLKISKRNNCFWLQGKSAKRLISPFRISSIAVVSDCHFSTSAILLAAENQIPIVYYSKTGKVKWRLWGPSFSNIATLRRKQLVFSQTVNATRWVLLLFMHKFTGQVKNINFLINKIPSEKARLTEILARMQDAFKKFSEFDNTLIIECRNSIMGTEGIIARYYWKAFSVVIGQSYGFEGRGRRPAPDCINAALNYFYGMFYSKVEGALISTGLDPWIGILHADEYKKPTLAFDMIEPFRPWADRLIIELCLSNEFREEYFDQTGKGFWLNKKGKKTLIPALINYLEARGVFGGKTKKRANHIHALSGELARIINNEMENV